MDNHPGATHAYFHQTSGTQQDWRSNPENKPQKTGHASTRGRGCWDSHVTRVEAVTHLSKTLTISRWDEYVYPPQFVVRSSMYIVWYNRQPVPFLFPHRLETGNGHCVSSPHATGCYQVSAMLPSPIGDRNRTLRELTTRHGLLSVICDTYSEF